MIIIFLIKTVDWHLKAMTTSFWMCRYEEYLNHVIQSLNKDDCVTAKNIISQRNVYAFKMYES